MKTLFAILFIAITLVLALLAYLFLQEIDSGGKALIFIPVFTGMVTSVLLLILLFRKYIK